MIDKSRKNNVRSIFIIIGGGIMLVLFLIGLIVFCGILTLPFFNLEGGDEVIKQSQVNTMTILSSIEENGDNIVKLNENLMNLNHNLATLQQQHVQIDANLNIINDKFKYLGASNEG